MWNLTTVFTRVHTGRSDFIRILPEGLRLTSRVTRYCCQLSFSEKGTFKSIRMRRIIRFSQTPTCPVADRAEGLVAGFARILPMALAGAARRGLIECLLHLLSCFLSEASIVFQRT